MKVKKTKKTSRKVDAVDVAPGRVENTINKSPAKPIVEAMNKPTNNGSAPTAAKKQVQQNGVTFPDKVERKIEKLTAAVKEAKKATYTIGEICDEIITDIGLEYGKGTFKNIAIKIGCNERQLRRCWDFYRLMSNPAYKTDDTERLRVEKPYAIFELGRILNADLSEKEKQELIGTLAQKTVAEKWTVAELATRVTKELDHRGKLRKKSQPKEAKEDSTPTTPVEIHGDDLIQYADVIAQFVSPERLKAGALEKQSELKGFQRLLCTVVDVAKILVNHVCDKDFGELLIEQSTQLKKAGEVIKIPNKAA